MSGGFYMQFKYINLDMYEKRESIFLIQVNTFNEKRPIKVSQK